MKYNSAAVATPHFLSIRILAIEFWKWLIDKSSTDLAVRNKLKIEEKIFYVSCETCIQENMALKYLFQYIYNEINIASIFNNNKKMNREWGEFKNS